MKYIRLTLLPVCFMALISCQSRNGNTDIGHATATLNTIFRHYDAGHDHLFNETYPYKKENKVDYLAGEDNAKGRKVAYLWPASGVFSGVNALLESTGDPKYADLLQKKIIPGLQNYFDKTRHPYCYQSYIAAAGKSDRFYDDNIWVALDFCKSYQLTGKKEYLDQAVLLWKFICSGWDNQLGGGLYWCEQKRRSKNTCSNAPASVLALKLFEATKDSSYFHWGVKLYQWTRNNLQDPSDHLYFDSKGMDGSVNRAKYTYNSGQMLQASALLFKLTGNKTYLNEARHIAQSAIHYFTKSFQTPEGKTIRLFKNTGNWFNAVLFRGYVELYQQDGDPKYIRIFQSDMDQLWNHVRDKQGLFDKDWSGKTHEKYQWLLDQASMVELWATLAKIK